MYAVIQTGGKQYRVANGDVITVEKLEGEAGSTLAIEPVLMVNDGKNTQVGTPIVEGAAVTAEVVEQTRGKKIVVFKKKKKDLEHEIGQEFPKVDGSYDYLLHIKTIDYTEERVKALIDESDKLERELAQLQAMGFLDMWRNDIKNM